MPLLFALLFTRSVNSASAKFSGRTLHFKAVEGLRTHSTITVSNFCYLEIRDNFTDLYSFLGHMQLL